MFKVREAAMNDATGSGRPKHAVMGASLVFDLDEEIAQLKAESMWAHKGHNAKTLTRDSELRVVLIALRGGVTIREHTTDHQVALQPLQGAVRVHLADDTVEVRAGMLLSLASLVSHGVEALEDAAFLLYLGAP
jgi:quercetin dioxygenase-like cupin family protein